MVLVLAIFFALFLLLALSTYGRRNQSGMENLRGKAYAHRGLYGGDVPENSMEAFRLAKEAGYGVELDVHLLKDGKLAVFHDSELFRMTGKKGRIVDLTSEQLKEFKLNGTEQTIPLFEEVMQLFNGEVPLIIELKCVNNCNNLCNAVCNALDDYSGAFCLESFDPRCVRWLRMHRPNFVRGQLTENYFIKRNVVLPWILRLLLSHQMLNFLTKPDFVAYRFSDRKTISNFLFRKVWKMQGVTWTITTQEDYDKAVSEDWIPIFEGFHP